MKSKTRLLVSFLLLFVMVVGLFMNTGGQIAKAQGKTLNVAFSQEPNTLNEYYTQSAFAQWATYLCQAQFYDFDTELKPSLKLAAEVPSTDNGGLSADGKTYTLKLKPGLKWSDGQPLNADDLAFTFQMIKDPGNNISQLTSIKPFIDTITKVDDTTVKVTFTASLPFAENVVSSQGGFIILPKHVYQPVFDKDKTIDNADENTKPTVFSGPYVLSAWKSGESMTFDANPNYVLGKPKIDHIVIKIFGDPTASYAALAAGQIDWIPNLQPADMVQITGLTKDVTPFSIYGSYLEYLVMNQYKGEEGGPAAGNVALQDVNVRRAIRMGINRDNLNKTALGGLVSVTDSLYASTVFEDKDIKFTSYDPVGAGKLLDAAGWVMGADNVRAKNGVKLELSYISTTAQQRKNNMAIIQQDLAKIGIKANLDNKPAAQFFDTFANGGILASGKYDLGEFANGTVFTNPANGSARAFMMCAELVTAKNPGGNNNVGYCNAADKVDDLQLTTEQSLDAKARQDAATKIQEIFDRDVPLVILYNRPDIYVYRNGVFSAPPLIGAGATNMWYTVDTWEMK